MTHITYSPQYNDRNPVSYSWNGEVLTATIGDTSDTFDFSSLAPGDSLDTTQPITTTLPYVPVVAAERATDGTLSITLLYTYGPEEANHKDSETL